MLKLNPLTYLCSILHSKSINPHVELFILESKYEATEMQPMKTKRGCMSTCCSQDKVYVLGGLHHEDTVLKKCEAYDIKNDKWDSIKSMNLKRK